MNKKFQNIISLAVINTIICSIIHILLFEFYIFEYWGWQLCGTDIISCLVRRLSSFFSYYSVVYLIMSFVYSILFFSIRLYEKTKKYRFWLLKLFITIFILWIVGLLLQAINTLYWGYWSHFSLGEWWLNVLGKYLVNCIYGYYLSIAIWIITTIITTLLFYKIVMKNEKTHNKCLRTTCSLARWRV